MKLYQAEVLLRVRALGGVASFDDDAEAIHLLAGAAANVRGPSECAAACLLFRLGLGTGLLCSLARLLFGLCLGARLLCSQALLLQALALALRGFCAGPLLCEALLFCEALSLQALGFESSSLPRSLLSS